MWRKTHRSKATPSSRSPYTIAPAYAAACWGSYCTGPGASHAAPPSASSQFPCVIEDGFDLTILSPDGIDYWQFDEYEIGKTFSAIALVPGTEISEWGMRWELDGKVMDPLDDLGVSNVIVDADSGVRCDEGCVAAFLFNPDREPHPGLFDDSRFE